MSHCKYCGKEIHWHRVDGKPKAFEDKDGTVFHHCSPFPEKNSDHKLLTSTITRVSNSETVLESHLKIIGEIKIRLLKLEENWNK